MKRLFNKLLSNNLTLGSVESMTAGKFAATFTNVPGASKVFKGSIVSYWASIKEKLVNVSSETINKFGVVSAEVAEEMAKNGREVLDVDVCVSITGNAGPSCEPGGKPAGCFYIGVATKNGVYSKSCKIDGKRNEVRNGAVLAMRDFTYLKSIEK